MIRSAVLPLALAASLGSAVAAAPTDSYDTAPRAAAQRVALQERMAQRQLDLLVSTIVEPARVDRLDERRAAARLETLSLASFRR